MTYLLLLMLISLLGLATYLWPVYGVAYIIVTTIGFWFMKIDKGTEPWTAEDYVTAGILWFASPIIIWWSL